MSDDTDHLIPNDLIENAEMLELYKDLMANDGAEVKIFASTIYNRKGYETAGTLNTKNTYAVGAHDNKVEITVTVTVDEYMLNNEERETVESIRSVLTERDDDRAKKREKASQLRAEAERLQAEANELDG